MTFAIPELELHHRATRSARQKRVLSACCIGALVALCLGCSADDGDSETAVADLAGGWSNEAANLFVCIAEDRRMWLGDSPTELDGPNPCTVGDTGTDFHCSPPEDAAFDGSIDASGNQLTIAILPCPTDPADCRASYVRDSTLTCD